MRDTNLVTYYWALRISVYSLEKKFTGIFCFFAQLVLFLALDCSILLTARHGELIGRVYFIVITML